MAGAFVVLSGYPSEILRRDDHDSHTGKVPELVQKTGLPAQLVLMFLFARLHESRHNGNIIRHLGCG
jgi:hypothetical protein